MLFVKMKMNTDNPIKDIKREQERGKKHSHISIKIHNFYDTSTQRKNCMAKRKKKCNTHVLIWKRHKCLHFLPINVTKLELFKSDALMRLTLTCHARKWATSATYSCHHQQLWKVPRMRGVKKKRKKTFLWRKLMK